jgi:hypothetical protein
MSNRVSLAQALNMSVSELAELDAGQLELLLEDVAALKAQAKRADEHIYAALNSKYAHDAAIMRQSKNVDTGTVRVPDGDYVIVADLPKKVEWDQVGLSLVEKELIALGEPVDEYIKMKRDVSETAYKSWPSSLKKLFDPHRTVSNGKATYKIVKG